MSDRTDSPLKTLPDGLSHSGNGSDGSATSTLRAIGPTPIIDMRLAREAAPSQHCNGSFATLAWLVAGRPDNLGLACWNGIRRPAPLFTATEALSGPAMLIDSYRPCSGGREAAMAEHGYTQRFLFDRTGVKVAPADEPGRHASHAVAKLRIGPGVGPHHAD